MDTIRTGFALFEAWPMMSVHFWGEPVVDPVLGGTWALNINNQGDRPAVLNDWGLVFYGCAIDPQPGIPWRPDFNPPPPPEVVPPVFIIPETEDEPEIVDNDNDNDEDGADVTDITVVVEETTPFSEFGPQQAEVADTEKLEILNDRVQVEVPDGLLER